MSQGVSARAPLRPYGANPREAGERRVTIDRAQPRPLDGSDRLRPQCCSLTHHCAPRYAKDGAVAYLTDFDNGE